LPKSTGLTQTQSTNKGLSILESTGYEQGNFKTEHVVLSLFMHSGLHRNAMTSSWPSENKTSLFLHI